MPSCCVPYVLCPFSPTAALRAAEVSLEQQKKLSGLRSAGTQEGEAAEESARREERMAAETNEGRGVVAQGANGEQSGGVSKLDTAGGDSPDLVKGGAVTATQEGAVLGAGAQANGGMGSFQSLEIAMAPRITPVDIRPEDSLAAVVIMACNRPGYLKRTIKSVTQ